MTHKLFQSGDICVHEHRAELPTPLTIYTISDPEYGFTTSQKPPLNYESLRALLNEAIFEKRWDIAGDNPCIT